MTYGVKDVSTIITNRTKRQAIVFWGWKEDKQHSLFKSLSLERDAIVLEGRECSLVSGLQSVASQ